MATELEGKLWLQPVKLRLKIDLVSQPVRLVGSGKYENMSYVQIQTYGYRKKNCKVMETSMNLLCCKTSNQNSK